MRPSKRRESQSLKQPREEKSWSISGWKAKYNQLMAESGKEKKLLVLSEGLIHRVEPAGSKPVARGNKF